MSTRTVYSEDNDPVTTCMLCGGYLEPMGVLGIHMWFRCRGCHDASSIVSPMESGDIGYDDQEFGDYDDED